MAAKSFTTVILLSKILSCFCFHEGLYSFIILPSFLCVNYYYYNKNEKKYVQLYFCALNFSYLLKKDKNWEKEPLGADGRAFSIRWKYLRLRAGQLIFPNWANGT